MQESPELRQMMERFYAAMAASDTDWFTGALSPSPGTVAIGSDPAEWWEGGAAVREACAAQLEAGMGGAVLEPTRLSAYEDGGIGWAADEPRLTLRGERIGSLRLTVVFDREDGGWRIVQLHTSIGVPNEQSIGMALPT